MLLVEVLSTSKAMSNTDMVTAIVCGILNVMVTVASHQLISNMVTPVSSVQVITTTTITDK